MPISKSNSACVTGSTRLDSVPFSILVNSHHGDSFDTGAERHPLQSSVIPNEPGDSTTPKVATAAGVLPKFGDAPAAPLSRFVIRLNPLVYLFSYDDDGSYPTPRLDRAKLFVSFVVAQGIADLLHGDVRRVVISGREILLALTDRRRPDASNGVAENTAKTLASDQTDAGAKEGAIDGDHKTVAPSFLIRNIAAQTAQPEDGKRLLFHFIEEFLTIKVHGLQSGFGLQADSLLFLGPHGSTLAVPISILLEPRVIALQIVQEKIRNSLVAFAKGAA